MTDVARMETDTDILSRSGICILNVISISSYSL